MSDVSEYACLLNNVAAIMYGLGCRGACCEAMCTFLHEILMLWKIQEAAVTTVLMVSKLRNPMIHHLQTFPMNG